PRIGSESRVLPLLSVMMPPTTIVAPSGTLTIVSIVRVVLGGGIEPETAPRKFETSSEILSRRKRLALIVGEICSVMPASTYLLKFSCVWPATPPVAVIVVVGCSSLDTTLALPLLLTSTEGTLSTLVSRRDCSALSSTGI